MKKTLILLLIVLSSCKKANNQIDTNLKVTDNDIYQVVNFVISERDSFMKLDGIKGQYKYILDRELEPLFNSEADRYYIKKLDTIFTKEDVKFMQEQILKRKNFKFNSKFVKSKKVFSADSIKNMINLAIELPDKNFYQIYENKFGKDRFYDISLPLFSKDKKTVLIKFEAMGIGDVSVYKKENGKWKSYEQLISWVP